MLLKSVHTDTNNLFQLEYVTFENFLQNITVFNDSFKFMKIFLKFSQQ